ncbi:hypothetical protein [Clostridium cochlearium]|uniref:Uncharacterized protein n=1 Tax=Clostridium cochlearium TaxID=1494 RepID=A0A240AIP8_CLOCO|nr:hypothetical protein [Clostridium cochlearium]SNV83281.1 Uncharacterised protein [Clostridium cochlearium]SQB35134.1 Uncharacterised protein [Clostridium cochlearium]STA93089.1 Uncharacterised protein [Clostridium cochlearium]
MTWSDKIPENIKPKVQEKSLKEWLKSCIIKWLEDKSNEENQEFLLNCTETHIIKS